MILPVTLPARPDLKRDLVRFAARYISDEYHSSWVTLRNVLTEQQCAEIQATLKVRGWQILTSRDNESDFPLYVTRSRYGRLITIRYSDYQAEMAGIK